MKKICLGCQNEFYQRNFGQKHCSPKCYWKSKKGQTHSWGNKISESLKGKEKTPEHLHNIAMALRVRKDKKCVVCKNKFYPKDSFQKTCSIQCGISVRIKTQSISCKYCKKTFTGYSIRSYCSQSCFQKDCSIKRIGENNPSYKNGLYTHANFQNKRNPTAYKHLRECSRYRKEFISKYGYQFCEVCKINQNGTPRFEVHHIYFASQYPKHKNLHDNKNLVHICLSCHHKFHAGKTYEKEFLKLQKDRGLKELFK